MYRVEYVQKEKGRHESGKNTKQFDGNYASILYLRPNDTFQGFSLTPLPPLIA